MRLVEVGKEGRKVKEGEWRGERMGMRGRNAMEDEMVDYGKADRYLLTTIRPPVDHQ